MRELYCLFCQGRAWYCWLQRRTRPQGRACEYLPTRPCLSMPLVCGVPGHPLTYALPLLYPCAQRKGCNRVEKQQVRCPSLAGPS